MGQRDGRAAPLPGVSRPRAARWIQQQRAVAAAAGGARAVNGMAQAAATLQSCNLGLVKSEWQA